MRFNDCPSCSSQHASRRQFLASLGTLGVATILRTPIAFGQTEGKLIDTHHHFYPPAYLKRQMEWEGARKMPPFPGVADWTPARAIEQQERRQDGRTVAGIHSRPVVRRWCRSSQQDCENVPRLCSRDAEGLSVDGSGASS
jgi:6-methylsalicylate decarboxylase